jgi:hypothetical protein
VLFDRTGAQIRFVDTGLYLPTQVCFAPDHSIWTVGWQGPEAIGKNEDYFILQNYSQDGQQLGAFLPRSSFDAEPDPVGPMTGAWRWDFAGRSLLAFTQSGAIYGQEHDVAVFDRATTNWRPVAGMPDGHLLGADGESLVFSLRGQSVLRWVPAR